MDVIRRGFVLAGGRSRRFGSDKAVAPLDGQPAARALVRVLEDAGLRAAVVARGVRPELADVPHALEPDRPDAHPLYGIAAIGGDDAVFVCPCDAVALTPAQVRALCAAGALSADSPLVGVWPAARRVEAERAAGEGAPVREVAEGLPRLDVGPTGNRNGP